MEDLGSTVMNHRYENVHNIKLSNLVQWSLDIALGMEFLASKKVHFRMITFIQPFLSRFCAG